MKEEVLGFKSNQSIPFNNLNLNIAAVKPLVRMTLTTALRKRISITYHENLKSTKSLFKMLILLNLKLKTSFYWKIKIKVLLRLNSVQMKIWMRKLVESSMRLKKR